jgi:hypothetical protein
MQSNQDHANTRTAHSNAPIPCTQVVARKARSVLSTPQLLQLLPDGTTACAMPPAPQPPATGAGINTALEASVSLAADAAATTLLQRTTWTKQSDRREGVTAESPVTDTSSPSCSGVGCSQLPPGPVCAHAQELLGRSYSLTAADLRQLSQLEAALRRAGHDST